MSDTDWGVVAFFAAGAFILVAFFAALSYENKLDTELEIARIQAGCVAADSLTGRGP